MIKDHLKCETCKYWSNLHVNSNDLKAGKFMGVIGVCERFTNSRVIWYNEDFCSYHEEVEKIKEINNE